MQARVAVPSLVLAAASILAGNASGQLTTPSSDSPDTAAHLTSAEIEIYKKAPTLIDWTPYRVKECPLLHKLQPAANQDPLPAILERAGLIETTLLRDFPQVSCLEDFSSESFHLSIKDTYHRKFQYIVIPHPEDVVPRFEEYRTDLNGNPLDESSLRHFPLITRNFVSSGLFFSPADQQENRYRYFGLQKIRDRECQVVGFAQDPERVHRVNTFKAQNKRSALLLQGLAWIDPQSSQILRVVIWLLAPRPDLDLRGETSTVDFYPAKPSESDKELWLPRDVTVVVMSGHLLARSTHHYSNFKLFRVESSIKP